ncbi:ankyrin repeat ph and sec7 domain containing protein secg-related [Anaeramoeba ignava]|uniref:Ankyrin repeat ph and sec7 domain containing protein secg-related n=1 Tax=Anaeramoeba ignava TaxID=1746090 RepID=A0A9Q0R9R6_ANAIG|nr:ankyrin repeat ph and sec7 domain containing protein secg-related [Anaeramoeba ignava]
MDIWEVIQNQNISYLKEIERIPQNELIKEKKPLLNFAIEKKFSKKMINLLIEKGANPNLTDNLGRNSFHIAILNNEGIDIFNLLIEKGVDINAKTKNKEACLHLACKNENLSFEIIKYLVEKGSDINATTDDYNQTPFHYVCKNENLSFEIIKYLVEKGSDINATIDFYNDTPLHLLCLNENSTFEMLKYVIEKGIDLNARGFGDQIALSILIEKKRKDLIELMLMNDVDIFLLQEDEITNEFIHLFFQIYSINEDLKKLLNSQDEFPDYQIKSKDSFKFNVHKLILSTRFDYNDLILQKFSEICSQKSKEEVEIALSFLYTGFFDFQQIYQSLNQKKKINDIPNEEKLEDLIVNYDTNFLSILGDEEEEKEEKIGKLFQEIGLESKWIENKKGRRGIIKDLSKLYEENETKDFTIISKEKEIKVHKLILILRSELYKGMFLNVEDTSNQVHDYSGKSFETIQQLIYFLYHDEFPKNIEKKEIEEEYLDIKEYYQLNLNSIIDLILK